MYMYLDSPAYTAVATRRDSSSLWSSSIFILSCTRTRSGTIRSLGAEIFQFSSRSLPKARKVVRSTRL